MLLHPHGLISHALQRRHHYAQPLLTRGLVGQSFRLHHASLVGLFPRLRCGGAERMPRAFLQPVDSRHEPQIALCRHAPFTRPFGYWSQLQSPQILKSPTTVSSTRLLVDNHAMGHPVLNTGASWSANDSAKDRHHHLTNRVTSLQKTATSPPPTPPPHSLSWI